jgi:hypothetical protein
LFAGASTISFSSRLVVEGVFRVFSIVHSFKIVDPILFVLDLTSYTPEIFSSFLMISLIFSSLVYPLTHLRKCISAASRRVMSRFVATHKVVLD